MCRHGIMFVGMYEWLGVCMHAKQTRTREWRNVCDKPDACEMP